MKIIGGYQNQYYPPAGRKTAAAAEQTRQTAAAEATRATEQAKAAATARSPRQVRVPKDLQPDTRLNAREQEYFEQLFPKSRREIRAYLDQQKKVSHEKGQIIDMRG